jgi:hypothetical protein
MDCAIAHTMMRSRLDEEHAMSTLAIRGLKPTALKTLRQRAKARGQSTSQYVRTLIENQLVLSDRSFDELLRPVCESFQKNGVTEQELDELVTNARRELSRRRPRRRK